MKATLPWILCAAGIVFVLIGCNFLYAVWVFKKSAIKTTGTIIKINTTLTKAKNKVYSPVISYYTKNNTEIIFDANSYSRKKYKIGDKIEVLYLENNTNKTKINTIDEIWAPPICVIGLGIAVLIIALLLFLKKL